MRILLDKDGVLYDLHQLWYDMHNKEHEHVLSKADVITWDTSLPCKENNCPADIFSYLKEPTIWIDGNPILDSIDITQQWIFMGYELGIITKMANPNAAKPSWDWLSIHYPHIPDIMMVTGDIKHWAQADILVDDAIHNLQNFSGIAILFDQPWNSQDNALVRANDWQHLSKIINRADTLLGAYVDYADKHAKVENRLRLEIKKGLL